MDTATTDKFEYASLLSVAFLNILKANSSRHKKKRLQWSKMTRTVYKKKRKRADS